MGTEEAIFKEYPEFRRDNPDPYVQMAIRAIDKSRERARSEEDTSTERFSETFHLNQIEQAKKKKTLIDKWGVPTRIMKNLEEFKLTRAIKAVEKFKGSAQEGWCLVLSSGKGTGKSTAAAHWLMDYVKEIHMSGNIKQIRRWWSGTRLARISSYNSEFEKICVLPVLVLDDLGVEFLDKNGNFQQKLDELLDDRYSNFRKTIITTNLNSDDFKERYGERVADRIREGFPYGGAFHENSEASMRIRLK